MHLPAGAIGKDGPSAGCAFTLAIFSTVSGKKVRKDSAVTGEITLTGKVLPVSYCNENLMNPLNCIQEDSWLLLSVFHYGK